MLIFNNAKNRSLIYLFNIAISTHTKFVYVVIKISAKKSNLIVI